MIASGLVFLSLLAAAMGKPMARSMAVHESRNAVPDGYALRTAALPDQVLKLRIALAQNNFSELERQLYDVSAPSSANYGKHLSKKDVRLRSKSLYFFPLTP